jgi:hypothetical protein
MANWSSFERDPVSSWESLDFGQKPKRRERSSFWLKLWRSQRYEDDLPQGYANGREDTRGIAFYNERRLHRALADRVPMEFWCEPRQAYA